MIVIGSAAFTLVAVTLVCYFCKSRKVKKQKLATQSDLRKQIKQKESKH